MKFGFIKNRYFIVGFIFGIIFIQSYYPIYLYARDNYWACLRENKIVNPYEDTTICEKGETGFHAKLYKIMHPIKMNFVDAIIFFTYMFSFIWLLPESKILLSFIFPSLVFGLIGGLGGFLIYYLIKILKARRKKA